MANGQLTTVLQHIHELIDRSVGEECSDTDLVEQFVVQHDEVAFSILVRRHGVLVLRVCQRVLHDSHAAEDAFQATFFILARKATSIRRQGSIASWLYAVAYRVAHRARMQGARRQNCERVLTEQAIAQPADDDPWMREVLQEELLRLADKFRAPLVLCYLEGKTYGQAARELGWSEGSMSRLLAQAREQLRLRLVRRGVALASTALGAVLEAEAATAVPACLVETTVQGVAAPAAGAGITTTAGALVQGVLRDMFIGNLKIAAAVLLAIGLLSASAGWALQVLRSSAITVASAPMTGTGEANPFFASGTMLPAATDSEETVRAEEMEPESPDEMPSEAEPEAQPGLGGLHDGFELPPPRTILKRRDLSCEEDLRHQLQRVPELDLETNRHNRDAARLIVQRSRDPQTQQERHFTLDFLGSRRHLAGLPLASADRCELDRDRAVQLQERSRLMRSVIGGANEQVGDASVVALTLRVNLQSNRMLNVASRQFTGRPFEDQFNHVTAVPTLMQMLPAEAQPVRRVLVEQLARIDDPAATKALARLAVFDLAPEVRADAIAVLAQRPKPAFRQVLLDGLRYPWAPAADHAAEALVALGDQEAVPALKQLLVEPDPTAPFVDTETKTPMIREVVRINHLRNCLMCHAPAVNQQGVVLAPVPDPEKPLPPSSFYYIPRGDILVRAEVTYLRQDFSVAQPVEQASPWPEMQRYDYLVRARPLHGPMPTEGQSVRYPQRDAVLFALKELQSP